MANESNNIAVTLYYVDARNGYMQTGLRIVMNILCSYLSLYYCMCMQRIPCTCASQAGSSIKQLPIGLQSFGQQTFAINQFLKYTRKNTNFAYT